MEDHELRWSRRLLGLSPVTVEPPLPPLRRNIDQQGSFEATGSQEIVPAQQTVLHAAMETNVVTPFGNSSIPTTVFTTGEFLPPNPPSPIQATMVSTVSTSHGGPIPSLAATTTPFTPSVTSPPFSYGMPSSGTSPVLSYFTLQTLGLGAGSSSAPLQGHMGSTPAPFNTFLTEEVIYLLHPLHSVAHINNPSGNLYTIVYLE
jgi:hypothetical protein